jgi:diadenosine tetraphosphate (Ap4A) HIT family hydrolase
MSNESDAQNVPADWRADRIGAAERGENPLLLARLRSGFAVIGDTQFLPGYCVLLASPAAPSLNALPFAARSEFLLDMALLSEAVERGTGCLRTNCELLGNTDTYLHAHVWPRYGWEDDQHRPSPVWSYPRDRWSDPRWAYNDAAHGALRGRIADDLHRLLVEHGRLP